MTIMSACYSGAVIDPLFERFRLRVLDLLDEKGIKQKELRGPFTEGWISNKIRGRRGLYFRDVQLIADALNVPLAELLRDPQNRVYDLSGDEARLIEAYRTLSRDEQHAALKMLTMRHRTVGRQRRHVYPTTPRKTG